MKVAKSTAFSNLGDSTEALVQQEPALLDEWSVNMLTKVQEAPQPIHQRWRTDHKNHSIDASIVQPEQPNLASSLSIIFQDFLHDQEVMAQK